MTTSFTGFPAGVKSTPVPDLFLTQLMPQIKDIAELKTTLYIFWAIYQKRGFPRFATLTELLSDPTLMSGIDDKTKPPAETIKHALNLASQRGTIIHLTLQKDSLTEEVYFLNTPANRKIVTEIKQGKFELRGLKFGKQPETNAQLPNIFSLYEQNIGMLTPIVAEELREAERLYPKEWIQDAIREAVTLNKRNWKYIIRILERWGTEGRNGKPGRDSKKETDPDKYIRGKYGRLVKR